jgi:hypothetical protein
MEREGPIVLGPLGLRVLIKYPVVMRGGDTMGKWGQSRLAH